MPIRDEAINVFMGLPGDGDRLELTYNYGVDSYELGTGYDHIALTVDDLDGTLGGCREGHRAREAALPVREGGSRLCFVRDPDGYRDRAHRDDWRAVAEHRSRSSTSGRTPSGSSSSRRCPASGGSARTRSTRRAHRRRAGRRRRAAARADGARAGDDRAVRPLLPRHGDRGRQPVATSAIRDATNRPEFLGARASASGLDVKVLSREEEARYGYLAAVNSTTLADGVALDLGGGSMQLTRVVDRRAARRGLVAARRRAHDRALPARRQVKKKHLKALRAHVREELAARPWLATRAGGWSALGGTVRNLAAAASSPPAAVATASRASRSPRGAGRAGRAARATDAGRARAVRDQAGARRRHPRRRGGRRGGDGGRRLRRARGDRGGPARGLFFDACSPAGPAAVRRRPRDAVRNLAAQYHADSPTPSTWPAGAAAVGRAAGRGRPAGDPRERELLWAAAMLHDIGIAVDYDDHHKHSRYLILNAGLPASRRARSR